MRGPRQLVADVTHPDPALAAARDLVGGSLAEQSPVDAGHLDWVHVGHVGIPAGHVEADAVVVVIEHQAHGPHRLHDLEPQRPNPDGVHIGAQAP